MSGAQAQGSPEWQHWSEPATVTVDNIPVAYRRGGQGRPLLFLHGAQGTRAWLPFHEQLATQADVIAPEHPGFGDTPGARHIRRFTDLALHYDAFLRELDLENVDLVGQGHGAWLAAQLSVTYPDRFRTLTLITPFGLRLPDVASVDIFRMNDDEERTALFNERADELAPLLDREPFPDGEVRKFQERTMLTYLAWNPRYDWRFDALLDRIQASTLVIGVDDDRYAANAMVTRYAELIRDARVDHVQGTDGKPSSHLIHIEAPDAVASLIHAHTAQRD